ncbi:MAG: O-antigen ligase family protein, partial [Actinomycetota bacterium]|nr:O-antigen ligase family protein [Actinomycetota bacterium]
VHVAMALAFLWIWERPTRRRDVTMRAVLTGIGLVAILVAGSQNRGGLVSATFMLLLVLVFSPLKRAAAATWASVVVLLLAFVLVFDPSIDMPKRDFSLAQIRENMGSVFETDPTQRDGTARWRLQLWTDIFNDVRSGDIGTFGLGFGPILPDIYEARSSSFGTDQPLRSAHNSHVTLLARMGLPGLILWGMLWISWVFAMTRFAVRSRRGDGRARADGCLAAVLLIGVTGMLVNAIFDPTIETPMIGIWIWSCAGLGIALLLRRPHQSPRMGRPVRETARVDHHSDRRDYASPLSATKRPPVRSPGDYLLGASYPEMIRGGRASTAVTNRGLL